jgi:hypothetical protein
MERVFIEGMASSLPLSQYTAPEREEIWRETEGGIHFEVAHHYFPPIQAEIILLTISGDTAGRQRIMFEFEETLGEPTEKTVFDHDELIDSAVWRLNEAA